MTLLRRQMWYLCHTLSPPKVKAILKFQILKTDCILQ